MLKKFYTEQPAHLLYPFDGGWRVIVYVMQNVFPRTASAANFWFTHGDGWKFRAEYETNRLLKYWYWCAFLGFWIAGASQYASAFLLATIFLGIQFTLLVSWAALSLMFMVVLGIYNFLYSSYYKIYNRCPDCHEEMAIPVFLCPNCSIEHTRLWPSIYGVFRHHCQCGYRLPTLNVLGRKKLIRKCAVCRTPINNEIGSMINVHIPVIGGPSTGKSNYIVMAVDQLIQTATRAHGYLFDFPDKNHRANFESNLRKLSIGSTLVPTTDIVPQAYNLSIKQSPNDIGRIVYIYDAAGEAYTDETNTMQQIYYRFIHGLIFIVDPFAIESFARQYKVEIDAVRTSVRPSELDVQRAFERMKTVLESSVGFKKGKKFSQPVAVVVTKIDALNLENSIGSSAARELMRHDPTIRLETDAMHYLVEQFLIDHQLGNLIRNLYMSFENVSFFACSSLGRLPSDANHSAFMPVGVVEPLMWLLGETKVFPTTRNRKKVIDQEHDNLSKHQGGLANRLKYYYWDSLQVKK